MGHHVSSQYKSALIYSRDNQIGLCLKIHIMLEKIRQETFQPDNDRVQRLLQLTTDRAREMQEEESDNSSSSSDASGVASLDGEHEELMPSTFKRLATSDIDRDHVSSISSRRSFVWSWWININFGVAEVLHHRSAEPPGKISAMREL